MTALDKSQVGRQHTAASQHIACRAATAEEPVTIPVVTQQEPATGLDAENATQHQQPQPKSYHPDDRRMKNRKAAKSKAFEAARHKRPKPLPAKLPLPSRSLKAPGTLAIQQAVTSLRTSLDEQNASSCHKALQELEAAVAGAAEEDLLAATPKAVYKLLDKQATQSGQLHSDPAATSSSSLSAAQDDPSASASTSNSMASSDQQSKSGSQQQLSTVMKHIKGLDTYQRADLFLGGLRGDIVELFLAQQHEEWAQQFTSKLPPKLPCHIYNSLILSCAQHNSLKTLNIVLEVC